MEMILNKTPLRTSQNYKINDIKLDINLSNEIKKFDNFIKTNDSIDIEKDIVIDSKIGLQLKTNVNLKINIDKKYLEPIVINFNFDEKSNILIDNIEINAEKDVEATIIIRYLNSNKLTNKFFHYAKHNLFLKRNSKIKIIIENCIIDEGQSFIAIENKLEENSKLDTIWIEASKGVKLSNYYSELLENNAENNLKSIYLGMNNDIIDINYLIDLKGEKTKCNLITEGALLDNSFKNYKGIIDFKKNCKKAIGKENENCLLLSENAKSKSLPMLLCTEEDVEGTHGVATGTIDEEKLFYIMSRGLSKKEAEKLIMRSNFNKILKEIENEEDNIIIENIFKRI